MPARATSFSFQQLARERFEALQARLRKEAAADADVVVHDVRRELKKLRALLRLIRPHWGEDAFRLENACLRDAGRLLAPLRDAWVHLALTQSLAQERKGEAVSRVLEFAAGRFREAYDGVVREKPPERCFSEVAGLLAAAAKRVPEWPDPVADPFASCSEGYRKSYQRSRARLSRTLSHPSVRNLHELRKGCKDLRYQLELLAVPGRRPFGSLISSLHKLTDLLGKNHDLAVLREALERMMAEALTQRHLLVLHESLEAQQRATLDGAIAVGCRLFAAKPKRFIERLEQAWAKSASQP